MSDTLLGGAPGDPGQATTKTPNDLPEWKAALPEDIRGETSLQSIQSIEALAKSYVHAQRMVGADKVVLPKADAPPEEWDAVFTRLGRPETPDKYELDKSSLPEGFEYSEDIEKGFRDLAHKAGLTDRQAKELHAWYLNQNVTAHEAQVKQFEEMRSQAEAVLKKEYGQAFEQTIERSKAMLKQYGDDGLFELIDQGLGNNPSFVRFIAKLAGQFGEDKLRATTVSMPIPGDAQKQIAAVLGDRAHPYHDKKHPQHGIAVKEMAGLFEAAYPSEARES